MRPSKDFKPGPSLEGIEESATRRAFRKGRFMEAPPDSDGETFQIDLTRDQEMPAVSPAEAAAAAPQLGAPVSKYEARSLSATVKREVEIVEVSSEEAPPVLVEIDIAEPAAPVPPTKAWTSEFSLNGGRYWRKDSRR